MKPAGPDNQNLARICEAAAYRPATTTIPHMGTGAEGISDQGSGAPTQSTHTFLTEDTTNHPLFPILDHRVHTDHHLAKEYVIRRRSAVHHLSRSPSQKKCFTLDGAFTFHSCFIPKTKSGTEPKNLALYTEETE